MEEDLKKKEDENVSSEDENKNAISSDLIRGHINTIILRTLYERDKYGYEIIEEINDKSHGQYSLKQPTLYSALKRLESQGYIIAYWKTDEVSNGGRRKYYKLTDSGREITEKNQSEWEYSRTVIDSLISDKNFDFSQPAPTPVDFKILKSSTSRVPTVKDFEREEKTDEKSDVDDKPNTQVNADTVANTAAEKQEQTTETVQQVEAVQAAQYTHSQQAETAQSTQPVQSVQPTEAAQVVQPAQSVQQAVAAQPAQSVQQSETPQATQPIEPAQPVQSETVIVREPISDNIYDRTNEQRRIHENYLKLISEPAAPIDETPTNPYSERIDTDKLIYNKKPETERDYKNLIDNLFVRTVKQHKQPEQTSIHTEVTQTVSRYDDASAKASADGLSISSSDYVITNFGKKRYSRGATLFKCSLIIAVIMLVEFALSLAFRENLGVAISYPIVILVIAVAQLLIFGVLTTTEFGKTTRKPVNNSYITTTIVLAIISILVIFVTAVLLEVNFANVGDIMAKIIIPGLISLNMPAFAVLFYVFSK